MDGNEGNTVLEVFCNDITVFNLNVYKTEYCIGLYGSEHHGRKQQGERELSQKGLGVYQVLGFEDWWCNYTVRGCDDKTS